MLVGLRGLSGLALIAVVTIRIFFYNERSYKLTISENHEITRRGGIGLRVTERRARESDTKNGT